MSDNMTLNNLNDDMHLFPNAEKLAQMFSRKLTDKNTRVIKVLEELEKVDKEYNIKSYIENYTEYGTFTPKQMKICVWRLKKHGIKYDPSDFDLNMDKLREKQLRDMKEWEVKTILPTMTSNQRKWYENNVGPLPA